MDTPTKLDLQREGIEYDRRQIRRKLRERLLERGEDLEEDDDAVDDEESVYEDTEFFPWKQREAAVEAAALGGRTEGRLEGVDSLERALQAHTHKLHYGRGRGFGWSSQQLQSGALGERQRMNELARNQLTDWTSFRHLNVEVDEREEKTGKKEGATNSLMQDLAKDLKAMKAQQRHSNIMNTVYLLSAIMVCSGFAYYIEVLKIDTYQAYLPSDKTAEKPVDNTVVTSTGVNADPETRALETRYANKILKADAVPTGADAKFIGFQEILSSYFNDRTDLQTEGTFQYKALFWLSHHDAMAFVVPSSKAELDHLVQRYALATFYFATCGNEWSFSDHFMTGLHECEWHVGNPADQGLFGASQCEGGKVTSLILKNNNLKGKLPKEMGLLTSLKTLDLSGNELYGQLPSTFSMLDKLKYVNMAGNFLSGNVDQYFCQLSPQHVALNCGNPMLECSCCHVCCTGADQCVQTSFGSEREKQ